MVGCAFWRGGLPFLLVIVGFAGIAAAGPGVVSEAPPETPTSLCAQAVAEVEARLGIPAQLLSAIALAESGRWDAKHRKSVSWPWTIYAEGHPHYPATKKSAIGAVRSMMARGVRNIDVGCLQVNLFYHPNAFDSLGSAFDPTINTTYAGDLLLRLKNTHRSWSRAIAFYHSSTRKFAIPYMRRVKKLWLIEHRRYAAELRDARIEALRLKKAERDATLAGSGQTATF